MAFYPGLDKNYACEIAELDIIKKDIISLYRRAVRNIQKIYKIDAGVINRALSSMYPVWTEGIDFHKFEYALAYAMCFAPSHTDLVRIHTEIFLKEKQKLTDRDKEFNIVSLSGGPADDIIGFLYGLSKTQVPPKTFKVTMVDGEQRFWLLHSEEISQILGFEGINKLTPFLNTSGIISNYIQAAMDNCDEENWKKIEEVVKEADVVIMFSSIIRHNTKTREVAERVADWMREGALLILGEKESFAIPDGSLIYKTFETVHSFSAEAIMPRNSNTLGSHFLMSSKGHAEFMCKKNKPDSSVSKEPAVKPPCSDAIRDAASVVVAEVGTAHK